MKKTLFSIISTALIFGAMSGPAQAAAHGKCGEVSITEMNWASSQFITAFAKFIMEQGYGCKVTKVPSSTVPAATSLAENGKPDIATEMWYNNAPVYEKLEKAGKVKTLNNVFTDGGVEGWWIPKYLADSNPELTKLENIIKNPAAVGGKFHNCPVGWGCRIANDHYVKAFDMTSGGLEVFNHGSGETLATSIGAAYESKKPWFGYYWAPTAILGKYEMVKVDVGPVDKAAHKCASDKDCKDAPKKSDYPPSRVVTGVTNSFAKDNPEVAAFLSKMEFSNLQLNTVLAWRKDNKASADEAAVSFIQGNSDVWAKWLNASAKKNLAALIK